MANALIAALIIDEVLSDEEEEKTIKKKRIWVKEWRRQREEHSQKHLIKKLQLTCPEDYKNFLRMDAAVYAELLAKVSPYLKRKNTNMRDAISPSERLSATLRYLATGQNFEALKYSTYIASTTLSEIILETCGVLIQVLKEYITLPKTEEEWKVVASQFNEMWNFPNCIGAIDGKHVNIIKPPGSGAYYFNYKKTYSIVLMALVNANYEFTMVEVGANGRVSDGGVFSATTFCEKYEKGELQIPLPCKVPGFHKELPYVFVADDAFSMNENFLKPYSITGLTQEQEHFNKRLSRARRVVENTFGIMASRFRVLLSTILLSPEKTTKVVLAICYLHNFLRRRSPTSYIRSTDIETSETININEPLSNANSGRNNNSTNIAKQTRNNFCEYINTIYKVPNRNI